MLKSRLIKTKGYITSSGIPELSKDIKYLLRRSFLGLPRIEISEIFDLEANDFEINIPNHNHGSIRNASLTLSDKLAIAVFCQIIKPKTAIEIGTFRGETTDLIARNTVNANIYTLDLPPDFTTHQLPPEASDLSVLQQRQPGLYIQETYSHGSHVHQIYGDSAVFDFSSLNQTFDFAFIDGAHSYEYVKNDTEKLLPLMNPGGWIVWDDYFFAFPDIIRYVSEFCAQGAIHLYGTRLAAFKV